VLMIITVMPVFRGKYIKLFDAPVNSFVPGPGILFSTAVGK